MAALRADVAKDHKRNAALLVGPTVVPFPLLTRVRVLTPVLSQLVPTFPAAFRVNSPEREFQSRSKMLQCLGELSQTSSRSG
jgi:hypothetical protein